MGLLDKLKFRKGSRPEKKFSGKKERAENISSENVLDMVKEDSSAAAVKPKKPVVLKAATGNAYRMLIRPHFSEKSTALSHNSKYVFVVHQEANKPEIKRAVEKVYDVHVTDVNILRVSGKARRYGRTNGRTKAWKKAIVSLRMGEKIEGLTDVI